MRKLSPLLVALCALLSAGPCAAGVVVLKNGKVLVGEVREEGTEHLVLVYRKPEQGRFRVERRRVRWYDLEADALTDAYFERFADEPLEERYEPLRERWRLARKRRAGDVEPPPPRRDLLSARPVRFPAPDGLTVSGDLYGGEDKNRPVLLLCHQARSSRGEYQPVIPRLLDHGYACLALDQRSGGAMNGVANETAARARKEGKATDYAAARQDIEAAVAWLRAQGFRGRLVLWGSSYSASLALMIGAANPAVDAVVAFSPGDYLRPRGTVAREAKGLRRPVLFVGPEKERAQIEALAKVVPSEQKVVFVAEGLVHGSKTLYRAKTPAPVWKAVLAFLQAHTH